MQKSSTSNVLWALVKLPVWLAGAFFTFVVAYAHLAVIGFIAVLPTGIRWLRGWPRAEAGQT
jgi:hypothetical protein